MDINFLPQIKKCPCCKVINIIKINEVALEMDNMPDLSGPDTPLDQLDKHTS